MTEPVGFGIIGTGMIAGWHAEALAKSGNTALKAAYDVDPTRARAFADKHGCRAVSSLDELFKADGVEAVTIATPSGLHLDAAQAAARAGKHILCEKPLEVTPKRARAIVTACEEAGVLLSAVFQNRYSRAVGAVREAMARGRFGQMVLAAASVRWYRTPEYYAQGGWRGTRALDGGGALMNQGIHTVDLLLHLNGPAVDVSGRTTRALHRGIEVEDTAAGVIAFENGSLGVLEASTACRPGFARRIELSGTGGSVVLEDDNIRRWVFTDEEPGDEAAQSGALSDTLRSGAGDPATISSEGHRIQIEELADAIRSRAPLATPGREALAAIDLVCALYTSAKAGGTRVSSSPKDKG